MVIAAAAIGFATGVTVAVPTEIPSSALQAVPVYRLEVGGALFTGLYIVSMAFVLAFQKSRLHRDRDGRCQGAESRKVPDAVLTQEDSTRMLREMIDEMRSPHDV